MTIVEKFQQGRTLEKRGEYHQAWETYQTILKRNPNHSASLKQMGDLAFKHKKYDQAVAIYQQILSCQPLAADIWYRLGLAQYKLKERSAILAFKQSLKYHDATDIQTSSLIKLQLAKALKEDNQIDAAQRIVEKLCQAVPTNPSVISLLAALKEIKGQKEEAFELLYQVCHLVPRNEVAHYNYGLRAFQLGKIKKAAMAFEQCFRLNNKWSAPIREFAACEYLLGNPIKAKRLINHLLQIAPKEIENHHVLCKWYQGQDNYRAGVDAAAALLKLSPNDLLGNGFMGYFLSRLGANKKALSYQEKAYQQAPSPDKSYDIGSLYLNLKNYELAEKWFRETLRLDKNFYAAKYQLLVIRMDLADWSNRAQDKADLLATLTQHISKGAHEIPIPYLQLTCMGIPTALNLKVNQFLARQIEKGNENIVNQIATLKNDTISKLEKEVLHIGYISPDFRAHAMGRLLQGLFKYHDRKKVKIFGYSLTTADKSDVIHETIKTDCDVFRNLYFDSAPDAIQKIKADKIDILVDLGGYTTYTRANILAGQPAPVQINWLGYPNTMGANFIQYIIADEQVIPAHLKDNYSEEILYLPSVFTSPNTSIPEMSMTKESLGLPANQFIFCAFHRTEKISPDLFDTWMDILKAVPKSVLWLSTFHPTAKENLIKYAESKGIPSNRLVFAPKVEYTEFLKRLSFADLFLDTYEYSAGSTAVDAINMGGPVLTCTGETYVSRMGASVVMTANQPYCITENLEDYTKKAIAIATRPLQHQKLKDGLKAPSNQSLNKQKQYARHLEKAFEKVWAKHTNKQ